MMVEDHSDDRSLRNRSVLADVTNQNGKRGFPLFSVDSADKDGSGYRKNVQNEDDDLKLAHEVLMRAKRLCSSRNLGYVGETPQGNAVASFSKVPNEIKDPSSVSLMDEKLHFERDEVVVLGTMEKGDASKKSCIYGVSVGLGHEHCSNDNSSSSVVIGETCKYDIETLNSNASQNVVGINPSSEPLATHVIGNDCDRMDGDNLTSKESSLVGCVGLSGSSSSKVSKSERCGGYNDDDGEKCKDAEETVDADISRNVVGTNPSSEALNTHVVGNDGDGEKCKDAEESVNPDVSRNVVGTNPSSEALNTHVIGNADNGEKCKNDEETVDPDVSRNVVGTNPSSEALNTHVIGNDDNGEKCKDDEETVDPDVSRNVVGTNPSSEALNTYVIGNDDEGMDGDDLTSNKSGSVGCVGLSGSSSSRGFESERCTGFSGDGGSDSSAGTDLLKACSCSFCLKAAHIWSDLHYQDAKGRLSVLKKSRKEVRTLVERSSMLGAFAKNFQGDPNKSVKLESDLVGGWRSLFLHTEDILLRESAQLQSSLITLKELRGNCKANLEMITGDPLNKK